MALKKLFLAHHSEYAGDVIVLATELRLRGIVPWVDKDGGFTIADESEAVARYVISNECFGLALYATEGVFQRPFVRDVEMDEAKHMKRAHKDYLLFAIPRDISFQALKADSENAFHMDLSQYHTTSVRQANVREDAAKVAKEILHKVLLTGTSRGVTMPLSIQFSAKTPCPERPEDILHINACHLFADGVQSEEKWQRVLRGLQDVKHEILGTFGPERILVHGFRHIRASFLFGRVFSMFPLEIEQKPGCIFATDARLLPDKLLGSLFVRSQAAEAPLVVEMVTGEKNPTPHIQNFAESGGMPVDYHHLRLRPRNGPLAIETEEMCASVAREAYCEIDRALSESGAKEVHLFLSTYLSVAMMLGHLFRGMPPTHLYRWTGSEYQYACRVPGGSL